MKVLNKLAEESREKKFKPVMFEMKIGRRATEVFYTEYQNKGDLYKMASEHFRVVNQTGVIVSDSLLLSTGQEVEEDGAKYNFVIAIYI